MAQEVYPPLIARPRLWLRLFLSVVLACALFSVVLFGFNLYQRSLIQRGILRILLAVTPGVTEKQVQERLGDGKDLGSNVSSYSDLLVPPGGHGLRYDSYMTDWFGASVDFIVVFDRQHRVAGLDFISLPQGWNISR